MLIRGLLCGRATRELARQLMVMRRAMPVKPQMMLSSVTRCSKGPAFAKKHDNSINSPSSEGDLQISIHLPAAWE